MNDTDTRTDTDEHRLSRTRGTKTSALSVPVRDRPCSSVLHSLATKTI